MTDSDYGEGAGVPRWVKLAVLAGVLVAVLVAVVLLMSGGHTIPRHGDGDPPASSVPVPQRPGHTPPPHG